MFDFEINRYEFFFVVTVVVVAIVNNISRIRKVIQKVELWKYLLVLFVVYFYEFLSYQFFYIIKEIFFLFYEKI